MNEKIKLNFTVYPLVVGQLDKYTFSGWEEEGGTIQLQAQDTKGVISQDRITWTSDQPDVATVEKGLVKARTTGLAVIKAALSDGSQAECTIQVIDNPGRLTVRQLSLNTNHLVLNQTEGAVLQPWILPVDLYQNGMLDDTFSWSSSDEEVAVVNHRGHVYAKKTGTAVITAVSNDVGRRVCCEIEVIKKKKEELTADPLEDLDGGIVPIQPGKAIQLKLPKEVHDQPVWWSCDRADIASVSEEGVVTAFRSGQVKVWATFVRGGYHVSYQIEVEQAQPALVSEIHLSTSMLQLAVGMTKPVYAVVFPATLLEKQLQWTSSDETVVRLVKQHINLSGLDEVLAEGVGEGTAILRGSCEGKTVQCTVQVTAQPVLVQTISLPDVKQIQLEEVAELHPQINEDAASPSCLWISDNRRLVTVDQNGVIKGYEAGNANIYCLAADGMESQEREALLELAQIRCLQADENASVQLASYLKKNVYAVCEVCVQVEDCSLSNLHIPEESVTDSSVCLLWNRKSHLDTGAFDHYVVSCNGEPYDITDCLSLTVKGLQAQTDYEFTVEAMDAQGVLLTRQSVMTKTRAAATVILDVTKAPYYAVGDGIATDTRAIQQAIDDCPPDGIVLLPAGSLFYCGSLFLKSQMTFQVEGILFGSLDPDDYPPVVCRWEGYRKMRLTPENEERTVPVFEENVYSHASLLNIGVYDEGEAGQLSPIRTENVRICGQGMINANSFSLAYNEGPCWYIYRKGLPVPQSPKQDQNIRGRALAIYNAKHVYVQDVTVAYSPSWTIHPVFSRELTFDHVKVISMGNGRTGVMEGMLTLNGDGIDPDSCTHVNIMGCYFTVGDDAVAIKSGRNRQGNELAKPSAYIRVTDSTCVDAKGSFCIGSEQAGGVHDVLFQNLHVEHLTNFGLWIKTAPCRGGLVEDVLFRDCVLKDTGGAMQIEYNHGGDENPSLVLPQTRRISYENIIMKGRHKFGIRIIGVPDSPITDITLRGFTFMNDFEAYKDRKFYLQDCSDIQMSEFKLPEGYEWEKQ